VRLLPAGQDPKSYYTNEFLPPASEMRAASSEISGLML
jgi:NitT/TauT family transport system substrate-binding protein